MTNPPTSPPDQPRRRSTTALLAAIAAAFAACGNDETARFDPASDDVAMAAIASAWAEGGGGLALSLCEDTARSAAWTGPDGCQVDHAVRGGGLGRAHSETHDTGGCTMGGCPHDAVAYVQGTASGAGLAGDVAVAGQVVLDANGAGDPYAYPYVLMLECTDPATPCTINGPLQADGSVSASVFIGAAETRHALARTGAATCP